MRHLAAFAFVPATILLAGFAGTCAAADHQADVVQTSAGPLRITPIFHTSVMLEFGGKVMYLDPSRGDFTGLPNCTAEIKSLKNIDVAFLLGLKNAAETAQCVNEFTPKVFYPYHYSGQNPKEIADALKGTPGVEVRVRKLGKER